MESTPPTTGAPPPPAPPRRLEDLFRALETPLLAYAMRLTRNAESAQDCVQEAFLRLHPRLNTGEVRDPSAWLYRTVHNLAITGLRAAKKVVSYDAQATSSDGDSAGSRTEHDTAFADAAPLPDAEVERLEASGLARLVFDRLRRLDPRAAEIVRLKFYEDLSYKEIATRTGLTVGHVGYILHHALKSLGNELNRAGLR